LNIYEIRIGDAFADVSPVPETVRSDDAPSIARVRRRAAAALIGLFSADCR
jgi:hypothetical protein